MNPSALHALRPPRRLTPRPWLPMAMATLLITGCTTTDKNGHRVRYHLGLTRTPLPPAATNEARPLIQASTTWGMVMGPDGLRLGLTRLRDISLPPRGGLFIEGTKESLLDMQRVLGGLSASNTAVWILLRDPATAASVPLHSSSRPLGLSPSSGAATTTPSTSPPAPNSGSR